MVVQSNPFAEDLLENRRIWISTLGSTVEKPSHVPARTYSFIVRLYADNTGPSFAGSYCLVLGYGRDVIRLARATKEFSSGV